MTVPKQRARNDYVATEPEHAWAIVQRAQGGDQAAVAELFTRYHKMIFRYVHSRVNSHAQAEDLAQDVWVRAMRNLHRYTYDGKDLGAWLVTIARNHTADFFKSSRYKCEVLTGEVLGADQIDLSIEGRPDTSTIDYLTNVELMTVITQLNPEQKECMVLRYLRGLSIAETAALMGKNEGAIKALQYRAVTAMARALPNGFDDRPRAARAGAQS